MRVIRALLAMIVILSLAAAAHLVNAVVRPLSGPDRVASQVRWLTGAIDRGAPEEMQQLFPEGAFFTHVLTGLAAAKVGDRVTVEESLRAIDDPAIKAGFGTVPDLDGGTFYRGWRLLLLNESARISGKGVDRVEAEARAIGAALAADPDGVPRSYPQGRWPCDAAVAMAAVIEAYGVIREPLPVGLLDGWLAKTNQLRDPSSGLLPHRIGPDSGQAGREAPRGSSQAIIQTFWPTIDPVGAPREWQRYVDTFVVREAGLVGVKEHSDPARNDGDEDSGPLLWGVSLSASAVTLAAARANGDLGLATTLDREAEVFGLPLEWSGQRRFAFGVMPVGDAFVAWARTVPVRGAGASAVSPPTPLWPVWVGIPVVTLLASVAGLVATRRRPRGAQ